MPEDSYAGDSPDPRWEPPKADEGWEPPPLEEESQPEASAAPGGALSTVALAAAGAAALNILLTIGCAVAWLTDEEFGLQIIASSNGLWLLLGIAATGLGAYIQRSQKKAGIRGGPDAIAATTAILSGMVIMSIAVLLPLLSAMRSMLEPVG